MLVPNYWPTYSLLADYCLKVPLFSSKWIFFSLNCTLHNWVIDKNKKMESVFVKQPQFIVKCHFSANIRSNPDCLSFYFNKKKSWNYTMLGHFCLLLVANQKDCFKKPKNNLAKRHACLLKVRVPLHYLISHYKWIKRYT